MVKIVYVLPMSCLRLLVLVLSLACGLAAAPAANAAPGELDPSFGSGGMLRVLESEESSFAGAIATQPDDKVVVAGYENGNCVVLRLLADGAPDPSFGSGGKVTTVVPGGTSAAEAVAIQPDGKIVVAGAAEVAGNVDFFFARYESNGSPDGSFGGGDGIQTVPLGAEEDEARSVAVGPDGRIVAVGEVEVPVNETALGVVVLKQDGTPDPSFGGGDGTSIKETAAGDDRGKAAALLADGSVLAGDSNGSGGGEGFTLMKLLPNGEYDPAFGGGDGIASTPIPVEGAEGLGAGRLTDFAVLPDGRIVASGYGDDYDSSLSEYQPKAAAVRYLPSGELDASFADGGIFTRRIENYALAETVALGERGRILLAGYYENSQGMNAAWVGRLESDGSLDPAFGSGGLVVRSDTAPFGEAIDDAAVDSQDRLLTIGTAYGANNTSWASVTRYFGDPRPATPTPILAPANQPAHAKMKPVPKKVRADQLKRFSGKAVDPDGNGVQSVQIALVKRVRGGAKAKASARASFRCFALNAKQRFKRTKAKGKQCPQAWVAAKGTSKWSFKLKGTLPPGKYVVFARAVDGKGLAESKFSRKLRNRFGFRVVR
jgi:uncharacterized delta-60 repeat protein